MRKYFLTAFVLAAVLVFATSAFALEKRSVRTTDLGDRDNWNAGNTCSVSYFNICTGWAWVWSGWSPFDTIGVCYDSCCEGGGTLTATSHFTWTGAPSGYGFTGVARVMSDDDGDCCPDATLASQVWLADQSGFNTFFWGIPVGASFIVQHQFGPGTIGNPTEHITDHPAAGPTGPQACGTCYPTTRANHSYYYGTEATPLCPGSVLNDGICDAQFWDTAALACDPVSVEESSFGQIKGLYR